MTSCTTRLVAVTSLLMAAAGTAHAQPADEFYKGREMKLIVGFTTGGGADVYARTIAKHLVNHIPGKPYIVLQFMPGANSLTATNWLYNIAPRDGSVLGSIHAGATMEQLFSPERARFDVMKFTWLGSASTDYGVTMTWTTSPTRTLADALRRETLMGGLGPGSASDSVAALLNEFVGTKLKVVSGYRGSNDVLLAMERGEVDGIGSWAWAALLSSKRDWVEGNKVHMLIQQSLEPHPELTARGVPFILDIVTKAEDRQAVELGVAFMGVGRPYVAPPGLPPQRAEILRRAFAATMRDPAYLAEAAERKMEVTKPKTGEELDALFRRVYATPRPIVDRVLALQKREK